MIRARSFGSRHPALASISTVGGTPLDATATPQADLVAESIAAIQKALRVAVP